LNNLIIMDLLNAADNRYNCTLTIVADGTEKAVAQPVLAPFPTVANKAVAVNVGVRRTESQQDITASQARVQALSTVLIQPSQSRLHPLQGRMA
jgi:hypothetical protein